MNHYFSVQLRREILLAFRSPQELVNPWLFFFMVSSFLPLAIGSDPVLLQQLGGGAIWVMALLASLLSLEQLFRGDYEDGTLDQLLLLPQGLFGPVLAKILIHWLVSGVPLALLSPLLAIMFSLPAELYGWLPLTLLLGTLSFSLVGAIGAALTVCLRRGGVLLSLIIMPLYVPILIFGAGSISRVLEGYSATGSLAILASFTAFALAMAPVAIIAALRIGADG